MPRSPAYTKINREQDFMTLARLNRKYTSDPDLPQELRSYVGSRLRECMQKLLDHSSQTVKKETG